MKTPEETWDEFKVKAFIGDIPKSIEVKMQKAFSESEDEEEKWAKLLICMALIRSIVNKRNEG